MTAITKSTNIVIVDDIIIAVDHNFEDFTGYSKDDVYKRTVSSVLGELFKIRVDVKSLELEIQKGPFLLFSKFNEVKEIDISIEIGSDINIRVYTFVERPNSRLDDKLIFLERQLVEQTELVRQQKEQLELILDNMSDGLFTVDENGYVNLLNNSARIFFKNPENQKQLIDNFNDAEYYNVCGDAIHIDQNITKKVIAKGKVNSYRLTVKRSDGIKHYDISGGPLFDANREVKGTVICTRDITEYIKISEIIREQSINLLKSEMEKNQMLEDMISMKDEFLSTISHEFKTPLNVINSAIQAMELLCKDELTIKSRKYLKNIRQNTFRQLRLVNNILDITKIHAKEMKLHKNNIDIVFISKSIVESVILYAQQKHIQLDFKTEIIEKFIGMDDEKYERILLNLLSNAIKFTPEGKEITVNISLKKKFVRIEVRDTGFGIPKDKQKLIFERFGQVDSSLSRQAEGAGIGLSLVNALVNALDGKISLKSQVGKGSSFIILLPDNIVDEDLSEQKLREVTDNRLIQSIAIEFSSIYFG